MKLKLHLLLLALCGTMILTSCSDDNDPTTTPTAVTTMLAQKYPNATNVDWEIKGIYYVADCWSNGYELEVWFTSDGKWCMTETDYRTSLSSLPTAVQSAFNSSSYASWTIDDIDLYERTDITFYLIEVETGNTEYKLYYYADGTLIKAVADTANDDIYPTTSIL